ncbi:MAG TPA: TetR/AcrR family transcriptional regulator [Clostridiales bacterium]|nr:TetR/AcrR family transcriptional regulator [Clostridiales bacterium]
MNKNESKYFNTARLMDEAFLQLLTKKDYKYITVKEICLKAGVNRSTFYLHYEIMDDLLKESVFYIDRRFYEKFETVGLNRVDIKAGGKADALLIEPKYLKPYLEFIKENKDVYKLTISKRDLFGSVTSFNKMYGDIFEPALEKFGVSEEDKPYVFAYYMRGVLAIVSTWIEFNCVRPIDEIINLIVKHTPRPKDFEKEKPEITGKADENERK